MCSTCAPIPASWARATDQEPDARTNPTRSRRESRQDTLLSFIVSSSLMAEAALRIGAAQHEIKFRSAGNIKGRVAKERTDRKRTHILGGQILRAVRRGQGRASGHAWQALPDRAERLSVAGTAGGADCRSGSWLRAYRAGRDAAGTGHHRLQGRLETRCRWRRGLRRSRRHLRIAGNGKHKQADCGQYMNPGTASHVDSFFNPLRTPLAYPAAMRDPPSHPPPGLHPTLSLTVVR